MEKEKFYVAITHETLQPTIIEQFENLDDAKQYAELMSRVKNRTYIVFEINAAYNITARN